MAVKPYIQIAIRTKLETNNWALGEKIIESLERRGGRLVPEQISHNADKFADSYPGKLSCQDWWASKAMLRVGGVLSAFDQDFAWKRKSSIKSVGRISHTRTNSRGQLVPGDVSLRAAWSDNYDWYSLFEEWCSKLSPQLGMLHVFSGPELDAAKKNDSFQVGSFNASLRPEVPDMAWAMYFGDEFSERLEVDQMVASGFRVERFSNGYLVMVVDSIQEVVNDFSRFSKRRAELKSMFPDGFFLASSEL